MHPDQLRSTLGALTHVSEHLLKHQHPEIGQQTPETASSSPEQPQEAQSGAQAQAEPQMANPEGFSDAQKAEIKGIVIEAVKEAMT